MSLVFELKLCYLFFLGIALIFSLVYLFFFRLFGKLTRTFFLALLVCVDFFRSLAGECLVRVAGFRVQAIILPLFCFPLLKHSFFMIVPIFCLFSFIFCLMLSAFLGSIIRCMRRLEELLREMVNAAKAMGNADVEAKFELARTALKRDIVFTASLYL